jgi:hypothetical protein
MKWFNVHKTLTSYSIKLTPFIFLILLNCNCIAFDPPSNAISRSLGGTAATAINPSALMSNVAALESCTSGLAIHGTNYYGVSSYSTFSAMVNLKIKTTSVGFAFNSIPTGILSTNGVILGIAKKLGDYWSAGIALNLKHIKTSNQSYYKRDILSFNIGILYTINDRLNLGFQASNPNQSVLSTYPFERTPSTYRMGVSYAASKELILYSDIIHKTNYPVDLNFGIEYSNDSLLIRGGIEALQFLCVGLGKSMHKYQVDLGIKINPQLGVSPALSIRYEM